MSELYWRVEGAREEEVLNPFALVADKADLRLEGQLRRLRARTEISA
jgi:hypothetical protein